MFSCFQLISLSPILFQLEAGLQKSVGGGVGYHEDEGGGPKVTRCSYQLSCCCSSATSVTARSAQFNQSSSVKQGTIEYKYINI